MDHFILRADLREIRSGIIETLNTLRDQDAVVSANKYSLINEVLTVGDYVIECGQYVLIIERKSIADLAASIVDKRIYENHPKLIEAANTDCDRKFRVMYLIEGQMFYPNGPNEKYAGIPSRSLRAKIDHLQMEDGCLIEWTKNPKHTALRLLELGKNMMTIKNNKTVTGGVDDIVKKKFTKSVAEIQYEMVKCIPGVGPKTAEKILEKVSFNELITGDVADKGLTKKAIDGINKIHDTECPVSGNMLTKICGVSADLANLILTSFEIRDLAAPKFTAAKIADLKRPNGNRVGNVLADRIISHFTAP